MCIKAIEASFDNVISRVQFTMLFREYITVYKVEGEGKCGTPSQVAGWWHSVNINHTQWGTHLSTIELQTNLREDFFTIIENSPTK